MSEARLTDDNWRNWNRKYNADLQELVNSYVKAAGGRPLTVVCLWYAPEYLREICSIFDRCFGESVDFVFAVPDADRLRDLAVQFSAMPVSIKLDEILYGISQNIRDVNQDAALSAAIPCADGTFCLLDTRDLRWLSEDLDVVHSNIELDESYEKREIGRDFLRGAVIDWKDLNLHYDADREKTENLKKRIEKELNSRTTSRLNLYHWPGAGGTTISRRIAWDLRRAYPVVILKRVTPGETISRLRKIFSSTSQPILALIEGAEAITDKLEQLYTEVKSEQIPVVFLSILRRFEVPKESERAIFLDQVLSIPESYRFAETYKRVIPNKEQVFDLILAKDNSRERTPFHFALSAFERDYLGITKYVEHRLKTATPSQREILVYIALAYYYGHKSILPQIFATHLGQPSSKSLYIEKILDGPQRELLIRESSSKWRPSHQLVAEEILRIVLSENQGDMRNWKRGLSSWALEFIKVCSKGILIPNDDLLDLMRRVFILRDEYDLLGTEGAASSRFSQIIEDIEIPEGKLSILKELVATFPDEAHFWGHLGRFYSFGMNEPILAIDALEHAIAISQSDPVLYHMKGMCYRSLVYDQIKRIKKDGLTQQSLVDLQNNVQASMVSFEKARELDTNGEHAYVSPVQLLLRVVDFGFSISGYKTKSEFLVSANSAWYRELLDEIENLMERVKGIREGEKSSKYVVSCQAQLDEVYDNYSRALEGWDHLLSQKGVFAPPIRRQIVRAYLARKERKWTSLSQKEIERIVDLMEQNMREESNSDNNIRIWFNAFRYSSRQDIDVALDRLATWKAKGDSLESYYYLYILHVLKAIDGSTIEQERSLDLIEQCKNKARGLRNRTRSFEWFGTGQEIDRLKHYSELGDWDDRTNFYSNIQPLQRVDGRVIQINGPEAGYIELSKTNLKAFFVPAVADIHKGRDENEKVDFYLGFSYDGLRAWNVQRT